LSLLAKKAAARKSKVTIDPQGILLDAPDFRSHSANNCLLYDRMTGLL